MKISQKYNYLIVDDEFPIVKLLSDILNVHPDTSRIITAKNGIEGVQAYRSNTIDIVLTDILMPLMTGTELIQEIKSINQDAQIIVVSAFSDINLIRESMKSGAYDYVLKPFTIDDVMIAVNRSIERIKFLESKLNYVKLLEKKVKEATKQLHVGFLNSMVALVNALEARDQYTSRHSQNVSLLAKQLGKWLKMDEEQQENLRIGGILHDIGKIGIPDTILLKPKTLTKKEFEIIKEHPITGSKIIMPFIGSNKDVMDFVMYHHEWFDGSGYPNGLKGKNIPLIARIANIADTYDAMIAKRVYRNSKSKNETLEEIKKYSGKQFDPEIVEVFINNI